MPKAPDSAIDGKTKWMLALCVLVPASLAYIAINNWNASPHRALYLSPRPLDVIPWAYQPWTSIPYLLGGLLATFGPLLGKRSRNEVRRCLLTYCLMLAISFLTYLCLPITMLRPDYSGEVTGALLMQMVASVDAPANCLPSLHTGFAVTAVGLVCHYDWPRPIIGMFIVNAPVVLVTTITTGQHYAVDLVAGIGVSLVALWLVDHVVMPRVA